MTAGYVIAQINVIDPETYARYVAMVQPTIQAFGGRFLVRGGRAESHEETPPGARNVIIRFPRYHAARNWYNPDIYAQAKALRMSASTSVQTIVEGIPE